MKKIIYLYLSLFITATVACAGVGGITVIKPGPTSIVISGTTTPPVTIVIPGPQGPPGTGGGGNVISVNGKTGTVVLTASDVGGEASGTAAAAVFSHLSSYNHGDIAHANRAALDAYTGPPDLSGYVPTSRTVNGHALTGNVVVTASDVGAVPTTRKINGKGLSVDISLTGSDIGFDKVNNTDDNSKPISVPQQAAFDLKADLVGGIVAPWQLPSFVQEIIECVPGSTCPETGSAAYIYFDVAGQTTYRWSGSQYVPIGTPVAIGETSTTAGRGDYTKAAYDHTLISGINHGNPHDSTPCDIGLCHVNDTLDSEKPVSIPQQAALDLKADLVGGKVPSSQLPSFVDTIQECNTLSVCPNPGTAGTIYVDKATNVNYRWSGTQ
jgi:hypothetical protein